MSIDELAQAIHSNLQRCENGTGDEWIEATVIVCEQLILARSGFLSPAQFNRWCERQRFLWKGRPLRQEQLIAALGVGKLIKLNEEAVRQIMRVTRTRDLRKLRSSINIYIKTQPKRSLPTVLALPAPVPPKDFKQQIEAAVKRAENSLIRQYEEQLRKKDLDHSADIQFEIERRLNALVLPAINRELKDIAITIKGRKGLFSAEQYNLILRCLHPDIIARLNDPELTKRYAEAFRLLRDKRVLLLPESAHATPDVVILPDTYEELVQKYRKKDAAE
jgi:hypothetical protein